jgi:molybdenum cofactor cytidylyltransferase
MADTAAILLAAGESRRMGRLKALLPWRGTTLLAHQVLALLEARAGRVVVVLGHQFERLEPLIKGIAGATWSVNPDYAQGKTTSIKVGLNALGPEDPAAVIILNVDQPRSPEMISDLIRRHYAAGRLITIPTYRGKGGHPIVVDSALLPELRAICEEAQGIKAVVRAHEESTHRVEMDSPEVLWDLNTPGDYQEALTAGESPETV